MAAVITHEVVEKLKEDFRKRLKEGLKIYDEWLEENKNATLEQRRKKCEEISNEFDIQIHSQGS